MKLSVYLDDETAMLLVSLQTDLNFKSHSKLIQAALKKFAESEGYVFVPAKVERINKP